MSSGQQWPPADDATRGLLPAAEVPPETVLVPANFVEQVSLFASVESDWYCHGNSVIIH